MASTSAGKALGILLVVVVGGGVVAAVGGALFISAGPFGGAGGGGTESTATPPPTGTVYTQPAEGTAEDQPPFSFEIDTIEQCGETCRDVTATLYNNQQQGASNVSVYTRIYVGNSTAEQDRIWTGDERIGEMEAGDSDTQTQRVELSRREAFAVQQSDGWITIHTTVDSEETTVTVENRRNVT
jgi:hypothetical protein